MVMHGSGDGQDDEELNMGQFSPPHEPEANSRFNATDVQVGTDGKIVEQVADIDSPYAD